MFFSIFDILASLFLMLSMMRRLDVKSVRAEDYPHVAPGDLARWRAGSMRIYEVVAAACVAKVVLAQLWVALVMPHVTRGLTVVSGVVIEGLWVVVLVMSWFQATEARSQRERLGLVLRRDRNR